MKLGAEIADISSIFAHFEWVDFELILQGRIPLGMRLVVGIDYSTKRAIPSECFYIYYIYDN